MGVRRLQTFLEQHCREACYEVSIEEIVSNYRQTEEREPVIVVDGSGCFRTLYGDLDWICGGQFKEQVDRINDFIDRFECLGVTLIIFFDGATQTSKRHVWVNRRLDSMNKAHKVIDALKSGTEIKKIDRQLHVLPAGAGNVMSSISKTRCTVRRSMKECDEEIVQYAENNKCLAILAQDSDFVVYQGGARFYLSLEKLDLNQMTTLAYDRHALARHLNLDISQLPVLASLMGNDFISSDDLRSFHSRLTGRRRHHSYAAVLVRALAYYVQSLPMGQDLFRSLRYVSKDVFKTPHRASDLKESILSYELRSDGEIRPSFGVSEKWDCILSIAHSNHVEMKAPSHIYNILRRLPFEMSTVLEDCRLPMPPSAVALRLMRQRIYGVTLFEYPRKPDEDLFVDEWCMSGPESLNSAHKAAAIFPPEETPSLLDLWQSTSDSLKGVKLKLLAWIGSVHFTPISLNALPHQIIPATFILSYLFHDVKIIENWEVKVFAAVLVDLQVMSSKELSLIEINNVDVRGVQLAALFSRAITHFSLANSICGNPIDEMWTKHHQLFDGKLFQTAYRKGKSVPPLPQKGSSLHFNYICDTILL